MPLPYDISRCATDNCPLAPTCRRKEPGHPTYQTRTFFPGEDDCYGYWPREKEKDDE